MDAPAPAIDLNADVGERPGGAGVAADEAIMAGVSSVSVACGFHAGDGETMRRVCEAAVRLRKAIGAHVSYLDREGFGRRELEVDLDLLREQITQQIASLEATAVVAGGRVRYVKPHGALYNRAAADPLTASAVARAVTDAALGLALLAPPDSELLRAAAVAGIPGFAEGFADRAYAPDGSLVPRTQDGAVLDAQAAVAQALELARSGRFRSLCLHSDTPGAAGLAVALRDRLIGAGFEIRPFA
jgi:UPF0271 protein